MADFTPSQEETKPEGTETKPSGTETKPTGTETKPEGAETKPAGSETKPIDGSEHKTFTQEDVNRIVADRLKQDRKKTSQDTATLQKTVESLEARLNSQLATSALREAGWRSDRDSVALKLLDLSRPETYGEQVKKLIEEMPEFKTKAPQTKVKVPAVDGAGGADDPFLLGFNSKKKK